MTGQQDLLKKMDRNSTIVFIIDACGTKGVRISQHNVQQMEAFVLQEVEAVRIPFGLI